MGLRWLLFVDEQIKEFKDYKIVRADWIVKSIEAGKL